VLLEARVFTPILHMLQKKELVT